MAVTRVTLDFFNKSMCVDIDDTLHIFSSVERFIELTNFPQGDCVNVVYELERNMFAVEYTGGIMLGGRDRPEIQWIDNNMDVLRSAMLADIEALKPPPLPVRHFRNAKLFDTDWMVLRHQDEVFANITPTLTSEQYSQLAIYRQNLRNIPDNVLSGSDVDNVNWPTPPSFLA